MHRKIPYPTITTIILILIAVLLPSHYMPKAPEIFGFDKLVHICMFFVLATAMHLDFNLAEKNRTGFALVFALAFSAATELLQLLVEGRSYELFDIIADSSGFVFGLFLRFRTSGLVIKVWHRCLVLIKQKP